MAAATAPINIAAVTLLGQSVLPLSLKFADIWRIHPVLMGCAWEEIKVGGQNAGARRIADFGSVVVTIAENATTTDIALPTITASNSTELARGISVALTSQAFDAIEDFGHFEGILDDLVMHALIDDLTHGSGNGVTALAASMTAVSTDSGANASVDGLLNCIDGVASQGDVNTMGFYDRVGFRGLLDWCIANGQQITSSPGLVDQAKALLAKYGTDAGNAPDGYSGLEIAGCRIYLTNKAGQFYTNGGDTYGLVMPDLSRHPEVQPPITIMARKNPIAMRADGDPKIIATLGPRGELGIGMYRDTSANINGKKLDYTLRFDPVLTNTNVRAHRYNTTYV